MNSYNYGNSTGTKAASKKDDRSNTNPAAIHNAGVEASGEHSVSNPFNCCPNPFTISEIRLLVSAGLMTSTTAEGLVGAGALTTTTAAFSWGTFATVLTRAISITAVLSIKNDAPPERYYVYGISGREDMAKFGITRQNDPANRPQSQISGLNKIYGDRGPHNWQFLKGPVDRATALTYEKYYVWAYTQNSGAMPYAQKYPYSDAIMRYINKK